jgi:CheY-like chemotaxis protein
MDRSIGGLGIGLTLVKQLVELHGGKVDAFSPGPGKGSEFVVRLPVVLNQQEPKASAPDAAAQPVASSAGVRVLIVDDNVDSADCLAMVVQLEGYSSQVAYDGPAALALALQFKPHIVLLDIGLPGMDGYEIARELQKRPETKDVILIAMTGWGQEEDRRRSEQAGFTKHLVKPVDPAALRTALAELAPSIMGNA